MGAGPEWEGQRKEENEESLKPGKVVPTGLARIVGLDGKGIGPLPFPYNIVIYNISIIIANVSLKML